MRVPRGEETPEVVDRSIGCVCVRRWEKQNFRFKGSSGMLQGAFE